jgi:zinc protease
MSAGAVNVLSDGLTRRAFAAAVAIAMVGSGSLSAQATVYEIDGIRVVQRATHDQEIVAAHVYLLGGSRQLVPETAGIEALILSASERGTEAFPGIAVLEEQVSTGSRFYEWSTPDWSVIGFTGLLEEFDRSWAVLTERIMVPSLDSAALHVVRTQALTTIRAETEDPDSRVRAIAESLAFQGHAYDVDVDGTEESLAALSVEDVRAYHAEQFVRSRMLLSVVGDVTRPELETAVRATLSRMELGDYTWELPDRWAKSAPEVAVEERALPTNYIVGYFSGPQSTDRDYPAFQVAVSILSSFVSSQIRELGLSYSAGAYFLDRAATGGGLHVSTTDPTATLEIIIETLEMLGQGTFPRKLLHDFANDSELGYYLSNQTSLQQADFLASTLLLQGEPQTAAGWVQDLKGVAPNDVRRMFRDYITNIQFAYLGAPSLVPRELMLRN